MDHDQAFTARLELVPLRYWVLCVNSLLTCNQKHLNTRVLLHMELRCLIKQMLRHREQALGSPGMVVDI